MEDETYDLIDEPQEELLPAPQADEGPIDHDLPCRHCGYNLRGMTADKQCPECGTNVGLSLLGDQLRYSDPAWVRSLARGMTWILWSMVISLTFAVMSLAVPFVFFTHQPGPPAYLEPLLQVIGLIPQALFLVGIWFLTMPEPGVIEKSDWSLRNVVRWTVIFSAVFAMINAGFSMTSELGSAVAGLLGGILGLVAYITLFVFARRLALRVPDYDLAKQTRIVMWGFIACLIGFVLAGILAVALAIASAGAGFAVALIPVCLVFVAYLVFVVWTLILVIRYRRVFYDATEDAENTWSSGATLNPTTFT